MTETDYGPGDVINALRRFWWLALMLPVIVGSLLTVVNLTAEYKASFSATILLAGDTEIPGSSERPELMILDDIGPVVRSDAFAAMVAAEAGVSTEAIAGTLDATRYSRVVTVSATGPDAVTAEHTIAAAATVFPDAVNEFMVAEGGTAATVNIIDGPGKAQKGDADQWTIMIIATLVSLAVGCFLALILDAALTSLRRSARARDLDEVPSIR
jgi:capsular polysaccharide biosynthesis protein